MSRFDVTLLDNDQLFNSLVRDITPEEAMVAGDLDVGSFAEIPFVTHFSTATQGGNGPDMWTVTLTISVFGEPDTVFDLVKTIYSGIYAWRDPTKGIVQGIGAVEDIEQEFSAFTRIGGEAEMENKVAVQYTGSWQLLVRNH